MTQEIQAHNVRAQKHLMTGQITLFVSVLLATIALFSPLKEAPIVGTILAAPILLYSLCELFQAHMADRARDALLNTNRI